MAQRVCDDVPHVDDVEHGDDHAEPLGDDDGDVRVDGFSYHDGHLDGVSDHDRCVVPTCCAHLHDEFHDEQILFHELGDEHLRDEYLELFAVCASQQLLRLLLVCISSFASLRQQLEPPLQVPFAVFEPSALVRAYRRELGEVTWFYHSI